MSAFIDEYLIEILDYPRWGDNGECRCVKAFFKYNSNTKEYLVKDTIIPVSSILNKEELPNMVSMESVINNRIPIMKRVIDQNKQKESWIFDPNIIEELKK